MTNLNIKISDDLNEYIESQVHAGIFANKEDFIVHLVAEYQKKKELDRLESLIIEGLESGSGREMSHDVWNEIRDKARQLAANDRRIQ